ncbi:M56 family metallopeptidase [Isoptericola cucumis]|uniref:Zn-dependent protease n=1 Tax=Isoptericola cucumis TaxID=1776856 RepID=A0ABQ2B9I5_9MICO|nr:M56 family metallopeptidase [Isoptericola cucumis]GGI11251.1 Zn-dependent protease [Isoptericola cucumis]
MTALPVVALLVAGLLVAALLGPWLLRQAAPALVRVPRLAVALLGGAVVVWLGTLLALGPVLAWVISGPALLPAGAAAVCQRCLAAANPFSAVVVDTGVPTAVLVFLPAAAAALLVTGILGGLRRHARRSRDAAALVLDGAVPRTLLGHRVLVVDDPRPFALAFPAKHGGVAVSQGALRLLESDELAAVLAHEGAHLAQRHHLATSVVASVARHLRWVPLIAAVEGALGHYLEIAADDQARRRAGTTALVGALLKLGERASLAGPRPVVGALHAAGPERIRHLVRPVGGVVGALPALVAAAHLLILGAVSAAVYLPYVVAGLQGCAV